MAALLEVHAGDHASTQSDNVAVMKIRGDLQQIGLPYQYDGKGASLVFWNTCALLVLFGVRLTSGASLTVHDCLLPVLILLLVLLVSYIIFFDMPIARWVPQTLLITCGICCASAPT